MIHQQSTPRFQQVDGEEVGATWHTARDATIVGHAVSVQALGAPTDQVECATPHQESRDVPGPMPLLACQGPPYNGNPQGGLKPALRGFQVNQAVAVEGTTTSAATDGAAIDSSSSKSQVGFNMWSPDRNGVGQRPTRRHEADGLGARGTSEDSPWATAPPPWHGASGSGSGGAPRRVKAIRQPGPFRHRSDKVTASHADGNNSHVGCLCRNAPAGLRAITRAATHHPQRVMRKSAR